MPQPLEFYNKFDRKLLRDYVLGNKRIESAITSLSSFIPLDSQNILDIGCGIGWSSHEFSKKFENALVEGIDLSPVLIEKASRLFKNDNLSFKIFDITKNLPGNRYDAILMIDVYEHISQNNRSNFHKSLKSILKRHGKIMMACPSKFHQTWLKENKPEGLQPIDEDIDFSVINDLAMDLGGEIIYFEYKTIWKNLDYFYAVIELNPKYGVIRKLPNMPLHLEEKLSRQNRVKKNLGILVELPTETVNSKSIFIRVENKIKKILNIK